MLVTWAARYWKLLLALAAVTALGGLAAMLLAAAVMVDIMGQQAQQVAVVAACQAPAAGQPSPSTAGRDSIPAGYLRLYQQAGRAFSVPWPVLAGIGKVESDHGQSTLPGVHSGANAFGAAGPMQIGIGGAAGNTWGGAPVHPATEHVTGVATDFNHDGTASVYDPADAIAGAAKYLVAHGVQANVSNAVFAYNHLASYVQEVLSWAKTYSGGASTVTAPAPGSPAQCAGTSGLVPNKAVAAAIAYARTQLGKPYLWGGTGPDAFDCSGLVMMAYRAAGVTIPRTSEKQWAWGPRVPAGHEEAGDLVFFAGSDGTTTSPGHVGLVIGPDLMIEAYATGFPIRVSHFGTPTSAPGDQQAVGFTRPWQHPGAATTTTGTGGHL
jgi:cell wall-associated NlpC family hydrolase